MTTHNDDFTALEFSLGDKLRKLRTLNHMSGEQLAHALAVNRNTVSSYERDAIVEVNPALLLNWCVQTGGRPSEVMGSTYEHLDEPALAKVIQIRKRRAQELTLEPDVPVVETDPFADILALEDDGDHDVTSPWKSAAATTTGLEAA